MSITPLKVEYLYEPELARERILDAFSMCDGSMKATARALNCHYATLLRMVKKDPELATAIIRERGRLQDAGVKQKGFGPYQRHAIENPA